MSFVEAVKSVLTQYATFNGRARRSEYWYFVLFNCIGTAIFSFIANQTEITFISGIWTLAFLIPGIAVTVRRLHDTGKSGWFYLLNLIPCIGSIVILVFCVTDSQPGDNQYGPNPKGINY